MPGLDRTGPFREGPRTGRGMGRCHPGKDDPDSKNHVKEDPDRWFGRGMAWRHGQGFFRGRGYGRGPGRGPGAGPGRGQRRTNRPGPDQE